MLYHLHLQHKIINIELFVQHKYIYIIYDFLNTLHLIKYVGIVPHHLGKKNKHMYIKKNQLC